MYARLCFKYMCYIQRQTPLRFTAFWTRCVFMRQTHMARTDTYDILTSSNRHFTGTHLYHINYWNSHSYNKQSYFINTLPEMTQTSKAQYQGVISIKREIILFVFQSILLYPKLTFLLEIVLE